MKPQLGYSTLTPDQKEDYYKKFMSSKVDIHFGFQRVRDSKVEDDTYATSMHWMEDDKPDHRLVLSRCSESDYKPDSRFTNQVREVSEGNDFTRWVNDKIDGNMKSLSGANLLSVHKVELPPDFENNPEFSQAFKKMDKPTGSSIYDPYKQVLAKQQITESTCINTNIDKIGQSCSNLNMYTKVTESDGLELIREGSEAQTILEFNVPGANAHAQIIADEQIIEPTKDVGGIKQTIIDHLKRVSICISRDSFTNTAKRRSDRSVDTTDNKLAKDKEAKKESDLSAECDISQKLRFATDNKNKKKELENGGDNNCSLNNSDVDMMQMQMREKTFTLSEIKADVLDAENVQKNPRSIRKSSGIFRADNSVPKGRSLTPIQSNRTIDPSINTQKPTNVGVKNTRDLSPLNKSTASGQKKKTADKSKEENQDIQTSRHIMIDLSMNNMDQSYTNRSTARHEKTVDRLLKAGEEYKNRNIIKKTLKEAQIDKECTFSPKLFPRRSISRKSTVSQNNITMNDVSMERGFASNTQRVRTSVISDNGNTSINTSRVQRSTPGQRNKNRVSTPNLMNATRDRSSSRISVNRRNTAKSPIKFEEPSFRPSINPNSARIAERRRSQLNATPVSKKKIVEVEDRQFSANTNSDKILREKLLEEIHQVLEEGEYLSQQKEFCDIVLEKEHIIMILQDLHLLPRDESETSEEMLGLVVAMWVMMSDHDRAAVTVRKLTIFILAIFGLSISDLMEGADEFLSRIDIREIQISYKPFKDYKNNYKRELKRRDGQISELRRNSSTVSQKSVNEIKMVENYRRRILEKAQHYMQLGHLEPLNKSNLAHADILELEKKIKFIENEIKRKEKENESMTECTFKPLVHDSYITVKSDISRLNKSSSRNATYFVASRVDKSSTVLKLELKIKDNVKERIYLYPNDNVDTKVEKLVKKHALNKEKELRLRKILVEQLKTIA